MTVYRSLADCWEQFESAPSLALDLETTGLHPARDRVAVIALSTPEGDTLVHHCPRAGDDLPPQLDTLLASPKTWITHNGTNFDLPMLRHYFGIEPPAGHYDTLIAEQTLLTQGRKDTPKDLGATMQRRLGKSSKLSIDHSTWTALTLTPEQVDYAAADVAELHNIVDVQVAEARERRLQQALMKEQELTIPAAVIRGNGLPLSEDRLEELKVDMLEKAEEARERVLDTFGDINLNSWQQVKQGAEDALGIKLKNTTVETLNYEGRNYPVLRDIITVRRADKRSGFYDEDWIEDFLINGRVYANYWQLGTGTTRFSSTKPNLQQIPRNMRVMIGNEPGMKVVQADFGQIELRIIAFYSRDTELVNALLEEDFHADMASTMFKQETVTKNQRSQGKWGTFTWTFAGGARAVVAASRKGDNEEGFLSDQEAEEMLLGLGQRFRRVKRFQGDAKDAVKGRRAKKVILPWGHQRILTPGKYRTILGSQYINTRVQGSAAIGFKEAVMECHRRGLTPYIGGLVHDEIVATGLPEAEAEDYRVELVDAMHTGMMRMFEIVRAHSRHEYPEVPVSVEYNVADTWE